MKLYLVRHGETEENRDKIHQGHLPGKLTELSISQAEKLANRLKSEKIDIIFSSDLARAADTARIIAKFHDAPLHFTEELREGALGEGTGKSHGTVDWENTKDVESAESMLQRAKNFLKKVSKEYKDKSVLLVAHGGINSALFSSILNQPEAIYEPSQNNTALNIFEISENENKVILFNSTEHLEK